MEDKEYAIDNFFLIKVFLTGILNEQNLKQGGKGGLAILKIGAQVMSIINIDIEDRLAN